MVFISQVEVLITLVKKECGNRCIIASSTNGWMNTDLTVSWTNTVLGQFNFKRRLLAWDTYECHLMPVILLEKYVELTSLFLFLAH